MLAFLTTPIGRWVGSIFGGLLLILVAVGGFRWWLHEHDKAILSGYVLQSELTAAEARAKKLEQDLIIGQQIREQADKEADQLDTEEQKRRAADDKAIAEDTTDGPTVSAADIEWVDRMRARH